MTLGPRKTPERQRCDNGRRGISPPFPPPPPSKGKTHCLPTRRFPGMEPGRRAGGNTIKNTEGVRGTPANMPVWTSTQPVHATKIFHEAWHCHFISSKHFLLHQRFRLTQGKLMMGSRNGVRRTPTDVPAANATTWNPCKIYARHFGRKHGAGSMYKHKCRRDRSASCMNSHARARLARLGTHVILKTASPHVNP